MHVASFEKMASFFKAYADQFPKSGEKSRVLDVGSKSYLDQRSYRELIDESRQTYVGLDLESGLNVDIVASGAYVWPEIPDETFDVCISGQTFEHNPFFWVTMCEVARVLKPDGLTCIIAPASGKVHRFPMDCWRFYPDSWAGLCALAGLEVLEVYLEPDDLSAEVSGGHWRDSVLIASKPNHDGSQEEAARAAARRAEVVKPFLNGFGAFEPVPRREGPAMKDYVQSVKRNRIEALRIWIGKRITRGAYMNIGVRD